MDPSVADVLLSEHTQEAPLATLTGIRAKLAREARVLKKSGKIDDTWTFNGNVMIKDVAHKICLIRSAADIERFR